MAFIIFLILTILVFFALVPAQLPENRFLLAGLRQLSCDVRLFLYFLC